MSLEIVAKTTQVRAKKAFIRKNFQYLIAKLFVSNVMLISLTILWCLSEMMTDYARARASAGLKQSRTKTIV